MAEDSEKLGSLGSSLAVKDRDDVLRCRLASGDLSGVLPVDIGLGPGAAFIAGSAGGVSVIGVLMGGRAGVANGRGLVAPPSGLSFFPYCCKALSTIACTFADTGAAVAGFSPRFPIVATGRITTRQASQSKSFEQCANQGTVDVGLVRTTHSKGAVG